MGWTFLTCVHGKTEGLDSHNCDECNRIARECGYDMSNGKTYIFTSQQQITTARKRDHNGDME